MRHLRFYDRIFYTRWQQHFLVGLFSSSLPIIIFFSPSSLQQVQKKRSLNFFIYLCVKLLYQSNRSILFLRSMLAGKCFTSVYWYIKLSTNAGKYIGTLNFQPTLDYISQQSLFQALYCVNRTPWPGIWQNAIVQFCKALSADTRSIFCAFKGICRAQ